MALVPCQVPPPPQGSRRHQLRLFPVRTPPPSPMGLAEALVLLTAPIGLVCLLQN